jgi:tetratricopeptide (TPR) repeat protein
MSYEAYCRITHLQVVRGKCPACEQVFSGAEDHRWDLARMETDVDGGDPYTIEVTVWNLQRVPPDLFSALPLYRKLMTLVEEDASTALALQAAKLTDEAAGLFETAARDRPDDLAVRIALLGCHSNRQFAPNADHEARTRHVLAVIERWPRSSIAGTPFAGFVGVTQGSDYEKGRAAWFRQIEANPKDPRVMGNAARFFIVNDNTKAGELFRRARDLDPGNPEWSIHIGHLYSLQEVHTDESTRRDWAAMALVEMERGIREDEAGRLTHLHAAADEAFKAGDLAKARAYASELLEKADKTHHGTAIFYGNRVLGLVCLAEGDVARAKEHLIASGRTTGSPVLHSFGPDMDLAHGLLQAGERAAVLEYLGLCSVFWGMGAERLAQWNEEIERGGTPAKWPSRF